MATTSHSSKIGQLLLDFDRSKSRLDADFPLTGMRYCHIKRVTVWLVVTMVTVHCTWLLPATQ